jgi:hypothetical protein
VAGKAVFLEDGNDFCAEIDGLGALEVGDGDGLDLRNWFWILSEGAGRDQHHDGKAEHVWEDRVFEGADATLQTIRRVDDISETKGCHEARCRSGSVLMAFS